MKRLTLFTLSALFLAALVLIRPTTTAFAQETTRLSVAPVTFELSADPGQTLTNQIKVINTSDSALQLETKVENISGTGDRGQVELTEEETDFSLSSWIKTDPSSFTLAPKETKNVSFTITVPKNAEPGGHYGTILVGTIAADKPDTTGAVIAQRLGSLVLVKVSGEIDEQAAVSRFQTKTFSGEWEERLATDGKTKILAPKGERLDKERQLRYFDQGPIAFDIGVNNSGNIHVKPVGYVTIYNLFNQKVAELPLDPRNIFPENDRRLTVIWPVKRLWGVYYRAQLAALYGTTNQPLIAQTTFWSFPMLAAIGLGALLLIIFLVRHRLYRVIDLLFTGKDPDSKVG